MYAQKTISGKVSDEDGQPLPSTSITIENSINNTILAYGISDSKGGYRVSFSSDVSDVNIRVKAFNHKTMVRKVKNETQVQDFKLHSEATQIKEVKLKTKLITKRGDTISYDINQFDSKADRTLADVIKKIPGMEVNSTGQITYQGEPINKFMVNGKDLMEGGYGAIVNALPKDAVQKMEVLENHQPVKILQDKIPSEQAAINIKLKKKITMTGRGEIGLGISPFLWNVKLTPMFFGQKNQWVINYKTNNNGEAVENDGNMLAFGSSWEGVRSQSSQRSWISVDKASTPSVPAKRYLLNNVHYVSANFLTSPFKDKEWELKVNASYTNNSVERSSERAVIYEPSKYFPSGSAVISTTDNNFYTNEAKGEVIFTKNAKKGFFKNTTTWNGFWNNDRAISRTSDRLSGNFNLNEKMKNTSGSIQNSLSTTLPFKEKLVNFMSYVSYQKDRPKLTTFYDNYNGFNYLFGSSYDRLDQTLELETFAANHSASVSFSYKNWTILPTVGLNLSLNEMRSQLFGDQQLLEERFQNDMKWNEVKPFTQIGVNYKKGAINFNLNLPMNFYGMSYKDIIRGDSRDVNKTVFEPSFWGSYELASFWKVHAYGRVGYDFGSFGNLYIGEMLVSPRSISNRNSILPENRNMIVSPRIEYRNPLNNLFFNVRYSYNENKKNLITKTTVRSDETSITTIEFFDNKSHNQSQSFEIGKYFPSLKTNLSTTMSNSSSNSFTMLYDEVKYSTDLIESKNNGQTFGFKFNNTYFSWLSVDYNLFMNWNKSVNLLDNITYKGKGWSHNLATYLYPKEGHTIGFFWDDVTMGQNGERFRNSFFDASYQFTWTKKKIDFELKWLNIGNKKVYETISYNNTLLSTSRSAMPIRPSQWMLTVKFNFK